MNLLTQQSMTNAISSWRETADGCKEINNGVGFVRDPSGTLRDSGHLRSLRASQGLRMMERPDVCLRPRKRGALSRHDQRRPSDLPAAQGRQ
jgi:hypothetical protein